MLFVGDAEKEMRYLRHTGFTSFRIILRNDSTNYRLDFLLPKNKLRSGLILCVFKLIHIILL